MLEHCPSLESTCWAGMEERGCDSPVLWLLPLGQASPAASSQPTQQQYDLIHFFCHPPRGLTSCTHRQHHRLAISFHLMSKACERVAHCPVTKSPFRRQEIRVLAQWLASHSLDWTAMHAVTRYMRACKTTDQIPTLSNPSPSDDT